MLSHHQKGGSHGIVENARGRGLGLCRESLSLVSLGPRASYLIFLEVSYLIFNLRKEEGENKLAFLQCLLHVKYLHHTY